MTGSGDPPAAPSPFLRDETDGEHATTSEDRPQLAARDHQRGHDERDERDGRPNQALRPVISTLYTAIGGQSITLGAIGPGTRGGPDDLIGAEQRRARTADTRIFNPNRSQYGRRCLLTRIYALKRNTHAGKTSTTQGDWVSTNSRTSAIATVV